MTNTTTDDSPFKLSLVQTKETLVKARDLIIEKGWTHDAYARNANGHTVAYNDPTATCFCMSGAMRRAIYGENLNATYKVQEQLCRDHLTKALFESDTPPPKGFGIAYWNDSIAGTKERVIDMFNQAIARVDALVEKMYGVKS